jgi:hypothetical protein
MILISFIPVLGWGQDSCFFLENQVPSLFKFKLADYFLQHVKLFDYPAEERKKIFLQRVRNEEKPYS